MAEDDSSINNENYVVYLGIKFGNSTFSMVSGLGRSSDGSKVEPIVVEKKEPSDVELKVNDDIFEVGYAAKSCSYPEFPISGIKRLIGRTLNDPSTQKEIDKMNFEVEEDDNHELRIIIKNKGVKTLFPPERIVGIIFAKLKKVEEELLYKHKRRARVVLTVPAYLNDLQRNVMKAAANDAGLCVQREIEEPICVVAAYGLERKHENSSKKKVMVFHMGGFTSYASIVEIQNSVMKIKATTKDTNLGGRTLTYNMVSYVTQKLYRRNRYVLHGSDDVDVWDACEEAKLHLCSQKSDATMVEVELYDDHSISENITNSKFEELQEEPFGKCIQLVEQCLEDAHVENHEIHEVILEGGSCRIPKLQNLLQGVFPGRRLKYSTRKKEAVAIGAITLGFRLDAEQEGWIQNGLGGALQVKEAMEKDYSFLRVKEESSEILVGIYLGNSKFSALIHLRGQESYVVNSEGNKTTPSYIAFTDHDKVLIGDDAKFQASSNLRNTIFGVKRLIGGNLDDPEMQREIEELPFKVVEGDNRELMIALENEGRKTFSLEQILGMIYTKLMEMCTKVRRYTCKAVLTVPAYFNELQLKATKVAAAIAGFNVIHVIDEPIGAIVAHCLDQKYNDFAKRNVMVFHMGGFTCSASIVGIQNSVLMVKATTKDTNLGGRNFTNSMVEYVIERFKHQHHLEVDSKDITETMRRMIWNACEEAKMHLSGKENETSTISIRQFWNGIDMVEKITRLKFEQLSQHLLEKCMKLVEQCLSDAQLDEDMIHEMVLTGSSCRIPKLQKLLRQLFKKKTFIYSPRHKGIVARGAITTCIRLETKQSMWMKNGRRGTFRSEENKIAWENAENDPCSEDEGNGVVDNQPVIGIDFGTTNSCVAIWENGGAQIIINEQGNRITPSYIAFDEDEDEVLIGEPAKNKLFGNPKCTTIFGVKRMIGKQYSDLTDDDLKFWPFEVIKGEDDEPRIIVESKGAVKSYCPEDISSMILKEMKKFAENWLNRGPITSAVVTVPAYFGQKRRKAVRDAAARAELNILRFINEPVAAAAAYGLERKYQSTGKKNVLVFDLGGGTLDVSLLEIVYSEVVVKATTGDNQLGGEDFDNRMVNYLIDIFKEETNIDITKQARSVRKLKKACEEAKKQLSIERCVSARIEVESLCRGIDFYHRILRSKFEELNKDLFDKCIEPVKQCLVDAMMDKDEVDEVVLVGGSSRILMIRKLLHDFFEGKEFCYDLHPDEAVARGAAILGAKLSGEKDESLRDFDLEDTTPLSLGVEGESGKMLVVIPRNTRYPTKKFIMYPTLHHNQTEVNFKVYEGEKPKAEDNNFLDSFKLSGMRAAPAGDNMVEVSFTIDVNGMLQVTAKEVNARNVAGISLTDESKRLNKKKIAEMISEADKVKSEEQKMNKKFKAKKELEEYVALLATRLNDTHVALKLGIYAHGNLKVLTTNAMNWSKTVGPAEKTSEFEKVLNDLKAAVNPFRKDLRL